MKKNEKRAILILVILVILVSIVLIVRNNSMKDKTEKLPQEQQQGQNSNGTKTIQDKKVDGLEIKNINIQEQNGEITVRANVENNTGTSRPETFITIKLKNKQGEVIQELGALVGETQSGETRQIVATVSAQLDQIEDIEITK